MRFFIQRGGGGGGGLCSGGGKVTQIEEVLLYGFAVWPFATVIRMEDNLRFFWKRNDSVEWLFKVFVLKVRDKTGMQPIKIMQLIDIQWDYHFSAKSAYYSALKGEGWGIKQAEDREER